MRFDFRAIVAIAAITFAGVAPVGAQVDTHHVAADTRGAFKAPHVPGELIVKMRDGASKAADRELELAGLEVVRRSATVESVTLVRAATAESAEAAAVQLAESPNVEYAVPNHLLFTNSTPNDPRFDDQWGLSSNTGVDVSALQAWDRTVGGDEVVVGVIDSGMDVKHKDLRENLYINPGEVDGNGVDDDGNGYVDDVNGWDAVTNSGNMKDEDSHGTHVAGIVGARGNNGEGIAGMMWRVKLLPLRFIKVQSGSTFDAVECIDYAVRLRERGVNLRVLNNSWGGSPFNSALYDAIERANKAGIAFVCAAGNDSVDNDASPHYPSSYEIPNVISVGAIHKASGVAGFSNYGPRSVDVFAPGDGILSTVPGGGYASFNGTSQASPFVAGIAGLVAAHRPDATPSEIKARVLGSATKEGYLAGRALTGGRVSAARALSNDPTGPGDLVDFALRSVTRSTIVLEWTSVGDDGATGQAAYYDIRYADAPITAANFGSARQINDTRIPLRAGATETAVVRGCFPEGAPVFVAMRVYDGAGNATQSGTLIAEPIGEIPTYDQLPFDDVDTSLGEPIGLRADDQAKAVELPFEFPFYGGAYATAYISTNGLITFDGPVAAPVGNRTELSRLSAIAPLWNDLRTDGRLSAHEDIYMKAGPGRVTFRWIAELFYLPNQQPKDAQAITFAVTLHEDGRVDIVYGPGGNRDLRTGSYTPTIGISDGGCAVMTLDGYTGESSLAGVPAIRLSPFSASREGAPRVTFSSTPTGAEGSQIQFTVQATDASGDVSVEAGLPRNATYDAATGNVRFTPDSTQAGKALFFFAATNGAGVTTTKSLQIQVLDNQNLPEVKSVQRKKKVVFSGVGFRIGSRVVIDGTDVGDAKNNKKAPATKLTSAAARSMLGGIGMRTIVVVNPDGTESGPYEYWQ